MNTSYDVRVHGILAYKGTRGTTYTVRWKVAGKAFRKPFATKAMAESERSKLIVAQREGTAFDQASGLPEPLARKLNTRSWLTHAMEFVDMKWPRSSPKHRANIADALTSVTPVFLSTTRGAPSEKEIRVALYQWAFNTIRRDLDPPADVARTLQWLTANTLPIGELSDPPLIRKALDTIALRLDGRPAAATTVARKRTVLHGALKYAVELQLLDSHPFARVSWTAPKGDEQVDRRTVVNPQQARALLAAVKAKAPELEAFFGCMYYSALRPEEVLHLSRNDYTPPAKEGGWGEFTLTGATITVPTSWTGSESVYEDRGLKHRSEKATRRVPVPPALVALLAQHIERYRVSETGRLFVVRSGRCPGNPIGNSTYTRAWRTARKAALTEAQADSPLASVPYQLRHAAVSLWLNAGVPATQVADWAGHSVNVLLKVYAKCIDGQEDASRQRIQAALDVKPAADASQ